jgi:predicted esterase
MKKETMMHLPLLLLTLDLGLAALPPGYQAQVKVTAPTRLDWTFAVSNRSVTEPPGDWLPGDYQSASQSFELFVPTRRDTKQPIPLVLFISPSNQPAGWKNFEMSCKKLGFAFAGVRDAGNDVRPGQKRVRIILDVLDEVRRQLPIDPDRTYVAGFSGGGRMACAVGFALPEYFGGVMPICAGGSLREEPWLRQRSADRLSVALLTGQTDFNKGEVERMWGTYFKEVGVRSRTWTQPGLGHGIPRDDVILEALRWLDEAAAKRKELAKRFPASRAGSEGAQGREAAAKAILAEGKQRLEIKGQLYSGLMLLKGVLDRWPDLAQAKEAEKVLTEYENRKDKPWEADDIAEQRRFLIAQARSLDAYASGDLAAQYAKQRPEMLSQALERWRLIQKDSPDSPAGKEAAKRIPVLEKLLASEK